MLSGDKKKAEILRGLKNSLQYETVNLGVREKGLSDEQALKVLARESKKRQEAADLYNKAGEVEREKAERHEKEVIDGYLPQQLSEEEIGKIVLEEVAKLESPNPQDMGKVISAVRVRLQTQADGATIARLAKEALSDQ